MVVVPAYHHPLRLILILRKAFEMRKTVRLAKEKSDKLKQFCFIEKTMAAAAAAIMLSAESLQYIITILLDLIKAYILVQRNQVVRNQAF